MQHKSWEIRYWFVIALVLLVIGAVASAGAATASYVIDFEGLPEGLVVSTLATGAGISGDPVSGEVSVFGINPILANPLERNSAVIFDAACLPLGTPEGCSGDDDDLFKPELGNVLIVNIPFRLDANGLVADPNDDDRQGMQLIFDFAFWGGGLVQVDSLDVMDIEAEEGELGSHIDLYGPGDVLLSTVHFPATGDNGLATVSVGVDGVEKIIVTLNGSGAIDNVRVSMETPDPQDAPGTGTPGYWKNHPEAWPVDEINIGGVTYSKEDAIALMDASIKGDQSLSMFQHLVSAKLNVLVGNESSCIDDTISAADTWMSANPPGSNVKANSSEWSVGEPLKNTLDAYNNGLLCAPSRG